MPLEQGEGAHDAKKVRNQCPWHICMMCGGEKMEASVRVGENRILWVSGDDGSCMV